MERLLKDEAERLRFWEALELGLPGAGKILRMNPLRPWSSTEKDELARVLGDPCSHSLKTERGPFLKLSSEQIKTLGRHPLMAQGFLFVQEGGASEVVEQLDPRPEEWILDLCAAPGSKTTQILEKLLHTGQVWANEPDRLRFQKLDALTARHGAINLTLSSAYPQQLSGHLEGIFDAVLVDAPCSGESLFAKRVDRRRDIKNIEVYQCQKLQKEILKHAALMASKNARLIYSTCTYSREENEDVVEDFLHSHADWFLEKSQRRWPHIDEVPGGYWALLRRGVSARVAEPCHSGIEARIFPSSMPFVMRRGLNRMDGSLDEYAAAMAASRDPHRGTHELNSLGQAQAYMRGESLLVPVAESQAQARNVDVFFAGHCLGVARQVEGRLNNLLPKTLRCNP